MSLLSKVIDQNPEIRLAITMAIAELRVMAMRIRREDCFMASDVERSLELFKGFFLLRYDNIAVDGKFEDTPEGLADFFDALAEDFERESHGANYERSPQVG